MIFAEQTTNKLDDLQVTGRIVHTGQTRETWMYMPHVLDSYNEGVWMQGKTKKMNQAPIATSKDSLHARILTYCKVDGLVAKIKAWEEWCNLAGILDHDWPNMHTK